MQALCTLILSLSIVKYIKYITSGHNTHQPKNWFNLSKLNHNNGHLRLTNYLSIFIFHLGGQKSEYKF